MSNLNQGKLRLVQLSPSEGDKSGVAQSIAALTERLVKLPTQGGVDGQGIALQCLADWLDLRGLPVRILEAAGRLPRNRPIGLVSWLGPAQGPTYCITACLDTALFGDPEAWGGRQPNDPRRTDDDWLVGRGTADSKVGVAIFSQIMADLKRIENSLSCQLVLLVDSDEHTGRFGAVKQLVRDFRDIEGVFIGYPGLDNIKIGARGFYRAKVTVYGVGAHSGSSKNEGVNAIEKAADLVKLLRERLLPFSDGDREFGIGPRLTVTSIGGGGGYSSVPDSCNLRIDIRLTPTFTASSARSHLKGAVDAIDRRATGQRVSRIASEQSWPAYKLSRENEMFVALKEAAQSTLGRKVDGKVSGPSNVGNFLASRGIPATCGFGVEYKSIHAANEAIKLSTIEPVYRSYRLALERILGGQRT